MLLNQNNKSITNRDKSKEVRLECDHEKMKVSTSIRLDLDPNDRDPLPVSKIYISFHITRIRIFNSIQ